jgi:hypothetical protein
MYKAGSSHTFKSKVSRYTETASMSPLLHGRGLAHLVGVQARLVCQAAQQYTF